MSGMRQEDGMGEVSSGLRQQRQDVRAEAQVSLETPIGGSHPERPHWRRVEPLGQPADPDEDEWTRADGARIGFTCCPNDTERVNRMDDYDRRFPLSPCEPAAEEP